MSLFTGDIRQWAMSIFGTCNDYRNLGYRAEFEPRVDAHVEKVLQCLNNLDPDDRRMLLKKVQELHSLIGRLESRSEAPLHDETQPDVSALYLTIKDRCDWLERWWHASQPPLPHIISSAVVVTKYAVSRATLKTAVRKELLRDYRRPGHGKTSPLLLDENEVKARYPAR
jgi:hypothetical protein